MRRRGKQVSAIYAHSLSCLPFYFAWQLKLVSNRRQVEESWHFLMNICIYLILCFWLILIMLIFKYLFMLQRKYWAMSWWNFNGFLRHPSREKGSVLDKNLCEEGSQPVKGESKGIIVLQKSKTAKKGNMINVQVIKYDMVSWFLNLFRVNFIDYGKS